MGKQKKNDDDALVKLEFGKGWKKLFSKLKPWQIAILVLVMFISYLLVEFLKTTLESSLRYNPNVLVVVIVVVLLIVFFLVMYAIDAFSEDRKNAE